MPLRWTLAYPPRPQCMGCLLAKHRRIRPMISGLSKIEPKTFRLPRLSSRHFKSGTTETIFDSRWQIPSVSDRSSELDNHGEIASCWNGFHSNQECIGIEVTRRYKAMDWLLWPRTSGGGDTGLVNRS
ncbi:Uncharacterised protein r2_g378 [Pycnogonum litorale]